MSLIATESQSHAASAGHLSPLLFASLLSTLLHLVFCPFSLVSPSFIFIPHRPSGRLGRLACEAPARGQALVIIHVTLFERRTPCTLVSERAIYLRATSTTNVSRRRFAAAWTDALQLTRLHSAPRIRSYSKVELISCPRLRGTTFWELREESGPRCEGNLPALRSGFAFNEYWSWQRDVTYRTSENGDEDGNNDLCFRWRGGRS